ncbi:MAG: hypothetical protein JRG94_21300 [Deltaproteobacteria bacterium]|nr:hypothetical protein [Deltaproteobacteria bacterium]
MQEKQFVQSSFRVRSSLMRAEALRWIAITGCVCALLASTGCTGIGLYATPSFPDMVERFPFHAKRPIAREIRYSYATNMILNGKDHPRYASDHQTLEAHHGVPRYEVPAVTNSGRTLSDDYSQRGRDASAKGKHQAAQTYHELAESQARAEMSMQRTQASVGLAMSTYSGLVTAGNAWVQATTERTAVALRDWVVNSNRAIGPEAPKGTVLQLDVRNIFDAKSFQLESRRDILVTVTLRDARGRTLVGGSAWQLYGLKREGSKLEVPNDLVDIHRGSLPEEKKAQMESVAGLPEGYFLAMTVDDAIANLYERLRIRDGAR